MRWERRKNLGFLFAGILCLLAGCERSTGKSRGGAVERAEQLREVINQNAGHAHFTRGMNVYTITALRAQVTDKDIPALQMLRNDPDHVTRLTAGYVLSVMGDEAIAAMKKAQIDLHRSDIEAAIQNAGQTKKSIEEHRHTERP